MARYKIYAEIKRYIAFDGEIEAETAGQAAAMARVILRMDAHDLDPKWAPTMDGDENGITIFSNYKVREEINLEKE